MFFSVVNVRVQVNGNSHATPYNSSPNDRLKHTYSPNSYPQNNHNDSPGYQYGRFDASALHIAHALKQTELQKAYSRPREKPIDCYLVSLVNLKCIISHNTYIIVK